MLEKQLGLEIKCTLTMDDAELALSLSLMDIAKTTLGSAMLGCWMVDWDEMSDKINSKRVHLIDT